METTVRSDLREAHAETVKWIRRPGAAWTGAQKIAMVDEVRRARAAEPLPPWVAPSNLDDFVDRGVLPPAAVDAVWKMTNHPGTTTPDWLEKLLAAGIEAAAYVELVAVVSFANSLESFAAGIGSAPPTLGTAVAGDPTGEVCEAAAVSSHWVPTDPDFVGPNIRKALTAVPGAVRTVARLATAQYLPGDVIFGDMTWSRGALDRMQVELLAARTSMLNECFY